MTRRDVLRLAGPLVTGPIAARGAACQSVLDPRTSADYDAYLKKARAAVEVPLGPGSRVLESNQPYVWNVHKDRPNGALAVYKGVIVDWIGAIVMAGVSLEKFQSVLQRYENYKNFYKPYIFDCYARPIAGPGVKNFAVTSILHDVYEKPAPLVPDQHFSFEVMAESNYFRMGSEEAPTLVIRTHANSIREAGSGHPEHADSRSENDLLPQGHGQGVLWRSDTWWRATQRGADLYAEYESLSLARSLEAVEFFSLCTMLKLPGIKGKALESMTVRPRRTVIAVITDTKAACTA